MTVPLIERNINVACGEDCRMVMDCGSGARVAGIVKANPDAVIRPILSTSVGDFSASCVEQGSEAAAVPRMAGHKLACEFGNPGLRGFGGLGGHGGVGPSLLDTSNSCAHFKSN